MDERLALQTCYQGELHYIIRTLQHTTLKQFYAILLRKIVLNENNVSTHVCLFNKFRYVLNNAGFL